MAKWGEGDPRWIVEERPDAINVNNWHWTEKSASYWSKDRFKELFVNLSLDNSAGSCKITKVEKTEGEASANNRKGKIIVFYDWELKLKWEGKVKSSDDSVKTLSGFIEIPNLSDENDVDDFDIQVTAESSNDQSFRMKQAIIKEGTSIIKSKLVGYISALKEEFTKGMVLPKKEETSKTSINNMSNLSINSSESKTKVTSSPTQEKQTYEKGDPGVRLDICEIKSYAELKCKAQEIFNVLVTPQLFAVFTNGSGKIDPKVGGLFEAFGGNVKGKILELDEPKKIVQEWRLKSWQPADHYSHVTITFIEKQDSTEVHVVQKGVPREEKENTELGWERYYWDAIKKTFGFGSFIL